MTRADLTIDIVYTWVNGSDPKLQALKEHYQDISPLFQMYRAGAGRGMGVGGGSVIRGTGTTKDQTANRFRDMDELKYSVRSVAEYAKDMFKKIHILTTTVDGESDEVQVPSWLDMDTSKEVIQLVPHRAIFGNVSVLPSFSSLSIESQIHHIPNLTDVFMYLNDDVFLGTPTTAATVWTPLYGFVFHMEPTLLVPPTLLDFPANSIVFGEWNSLQYSNYLLSRQFGPRHRSYLAHVPHVLSTPILQEMQDMWPEEFAETSSHRFRGEGQAMDVHVSFFMAHYVMERLRESQLSSFWFYRLDANQDGVLDWSERQQFIERVEKWNKAEQDLLQHYPPSPYSRNFSSYTQNSDARLRQLGFSSPSPSIYRLSGQDGYPFMLKYANTTSSPNNWQSTPYLPYEEVGLRNCHLDVKFCLSPLFLDSTIPEIDNITSAKIFERLAFSEFHCGDCLLHMLRQTATEPGLAGEIMPLDRTSDAYKTVSSDLSKYNYVIATSTYSFIQLQEPYTSQRDLNKILTNKASEAFFCINDNVGDSPRVESAVRQVFKQFLDERFSTPSPWEKP
ncbi:Xanthine phosphoribosyltransferase 1 [Gamsiella multidivaricata]|nr:Xanthine phosphoribosyltransferase 1 [Gamsiella multidivaricata]